MIAGRRLAEIGELGAMHSVAIADRLLISIVVISCH